MKLTTKYVQVTPFYMFVRQASDNMEAIRANANGVERFFPMQFGGLFGQKNTMDLEEVMTVSEFDGAEQKRPKTVASNVRAE